MNANWGWLLQHSLSVVRVVAGNARNWKAIEFHKNINIIFNLNRCSAVDCSDLFFIFNHWFKVAGQKNIIDLTEWQNWLKCPTKWRGFLWNLYISDFVSVSIGDHISISSASDELGTSVLSTPFALDKLVFISRACFSYRQQHVFVAVYWHWSPS